MSNIRYDNNSCNFANYQKILQAKITDICQKIAFDDAGVAWVIFDAKKNYSNCINSSFLVGMRGCDYGFFDCKTDEIWISIDAIQRGFSATSITDKIPKLIPKPLKKDDFLANVLLDEITHYQTRANHGTTKYDNKLQENIRKYYGLDL